MIEKQKIITFVILAAILGAIFWLESRKTELPDISSGGENSDVEVVVEDNIALSPDERQKRIEEKSSRYEKAKEISTPDGFINTDGVQVADLIGKKVILVDFWTYSCINCQRTLPHLNSWHEEYADKGLVILGVHTPEFEFEKEYENVLRATEKFGVEYPVILDNDYSTWTAYKNRYWPRKYLIDIDGFIVYDHIGEGAYEETEAKIVELLNERSQTLGETAVAKIDMPINVDDVNFLKVRTPETYLGYGRSKYLANLPSDACLNTSCDFLEPASVPFNQYALVGVWHMSEESSSLIRGTGEIIIHFSANKVNLVAGSGAPEGVRADIFLDGEPIPASASGSDVSADGSVLFTTHDLYNLVDLKGDYGEHELLIRFREPGIQAFAFTFG